MPSKLTAQQSVMITGDCIRQVTHSTRPLSPGEPLVMYGVNSPQQASAVRHNVVANGSIGVPRFNFSLHPGFLATLNGGWTIAQLATTIRTNSIPNQPAMNFTAPVATAPQKLMAASTKFAEASALFAEAMGAEGELKKGRKKTSKGKKKTARVR